MFLYKLFLGDFVIMKFILGFNVEIISYNNNIIILWDMGGMFSIRRLWKYYYFNCYGIYFIIFLFVMVNFNIILFVMVNFIFVLIVMISFFIILIVIICFIIIVIVMISFNII